MEMETEQRVKTLPEELVEKIVAMMPFPSLFKARGLSNSWLSRFSPISSQGDEVKKRAATSFQKQVRERSKKWGSFFPVCFDKDFVCAYHQASQKWVKLPSLSFLPKVLLETGLHDLRIEGARLVNVHKKKQILYVANIFTRSWKELPAPPDVTRETPVFSPVSFRDTSSETYEAIFFCAANPFTLERSALIYESKSNKWSSGMFVGGGLELGAPAYLNGIVYLATYSYREDLYLEAFNVEEGTSEGGQLSFQEEIFEEVADEIYLVVCNAQLLMIAIEQDYWGTVHVLKIDLVSRELSEVGRGPPALNGSRFALYSNVAPASEGTHIFFRIYDIDAPASEGTHIMTFDSRDRVDGQMVAYNVQANEWSYMDFASTVNEAFNRTALQWFGCSFQPGLNPFAEV